MKKVSFIIPVYNTNKYISQCLESVVFQTGDDFEVVIIDDGSTDYSSELCDCFASRFDNVRVVHKKNEGLLATRRRGFKEATGEWFACVDSDDYIDESYLKTISNYISDNSCDMLMFDYISNFPNGTFERSGIELNETCYYEEEEKKKIYELRLLKNKYNNMWSKVIHRSVVDFDSDYGSLGIRNMCEDAVQCYELFSQAKRICFIPETLYFYRREIDSITAARNEEYWTSLKISLDLGWNYIKKWRVSEEVIEKYRCRCIAFYCNYVRWMMQTGNTSQINSLLSDSIFNNVIEQYDCKNLETKYLRFSAPIIIKLLKKQELFVLKSYFKTEQTMKKLTNDIRRIAIGRKTKH